MEKVKLDEDLIDIIIGLHCFFNDIKKVKLWLNTENLNLGGSTPIDLIQRGRSKRVRGFINSALDDRYNNGDFSCEEF